MYKQVKSLLSIAAVILLAGCTSNKGPTLVTYNEFESKVENTPFVKHEKAEALLEYVSTRTKTDMHHKYIYEFNDVTQSYNCTGVMDMKAGYYTPERIAFMVTFIDDNWLKKSIPQNCQYYTSSSGFNILEVVPGFMEGMDEKYYYSYDNYGNITKMEQQDIDFTYQVTVTYIG